MGNKVEKPKLKLLVDKTDGRILYAESDKQFVDLIFSFLRLPLASIVQLLSRLESESGRSSSSPSPADGQAQVGCLNNVYQSLETLPPEFMLSPNCKTELMNPNLQPYGHASDILHKMIAEPKTEDTFGSFYFAKPNKEDTFGSSPFFQPSKEDMFRSSSFGSPLGSSRTIPNLSSSSSSRSGSMLSGYVRDAVPFMITDDLQVSPVSTISSITLLQKFNLINLAHLEERRVSVGLNEALQLLRAMLVSNTPLTDVFGGTEKAKQADPTSTTEP